MAQLQVQPTAARFAPFAARVAPRRLTWPRAILAAALTALVALLAVASAQAEVIPGEYGVQKREPLFTAQSPPPVKPLQYHGGPVVTASDTYAIYWDPVGAYRSDWMQLIDGYLHDVGVDSHKLSNVFSVGTQYTGPEGTHAEYNTTFRGAYTDISPYPPASEECAYKTAAFPVCIPDSKIRQELKNFVYANYLPRGVNATYYVLTPPGVNVCAEHEGENAPRADCSGSTPEEEKGEVEPAGICGYHSVIDRTSAGPIVYAVQPWIAGDAGTIETSIPLSTDSATKPVLACQNGTVLVEPHQTGKLSPYGDYQTGLADVIVSALSLEQRNISSDPLLNGWYDTTGTGTGYEESDICQRNYGPAPETLPQLPESTKAIDLSSETINGHKYYLPWAFDSTGVTSGKGIVCWEGTELNPHFTAPNPVNALDIVAFDANESNFTLDANLKYLSLFGVNPLEEPFTIPSYKWNFGDGSAEVSGTNEASVFHIYTNPGVYTVALTVTDSGGNSVTYTDQIKVLGGAAEVAGSSSTGTGSGGSTSATTTGSAGTVTPKPPAPVVYEYVTSHSLSKAIGHGISIRYKVNEQVAGVAEVMLDAHTAKRLHIRAHAAKGLPAGYPREVVLGGAVLVTTKAGSGTLHVILPTRIAKRLARVHRIKLTLRITVRNSIRHVPRTTTLLSVFVLKG